jgi:hypothetical protein
MEQWDFYQHTDARWSWRNAKTASIARSVERFPSFIEALANAMVNGFVPGKSRIAAIEYERRSKPRDHIW